MPRNDKGRLLVTASALALGVGTGLLLRRRGAPAPADDGEAHVFVPQAEELTRRFLLYFVLPVWLAAGVADWLCHRAAHIEDSTGPKESLIHLLMLAEVSVPVLAGLFLEISSPVLGLMIGAFLLHDITALWDVSYAVTRRDITPIEQHVHSYLEMMPLMAIAFLAVLAPAAVAEARRAGREAAGGGDPAEAPPAAAALSRRRPERERAAGAGTLPRGVVAYAGPCQRSAAGDATPRSRDHPPLTRGSMLAPARSSPFDFARELAG